MKNIKRVNEYYDFFDNFERQISFLSIGSASVCGKKLTKNFFYLTYKDTSFLSTVRSRILLVGRLTPTSDKIDYFVLYGLLDPLSIIILYFITLTFLLIIISPITITFLCFIALFITLVICAITYIGTKLDIHSLEYEAEILRMLNFLNTVKIDKQELK